MKRGEQAHSAEAFIDVVETQDKDPLSGIGEVSGDVAKGGFFHADCLVAEGPFANIWLLPYV